MYENSYIQLTYKGSIPISTVMAWKTMFICYMGFKANKLS